MEAKPAPSTSERVAACAVCVHTFLSAPRAPRGALALFDPLPTNEVALLEPLVALLAADIAPLPLGALVAQLQSEMTSLDVTTRRAAMELLAGVLELAPAGALLGAGGSAAPPLFEFCLARLDDGPSLLPSLRALMALLRLLEGVPAPGPLPGAASTLCRALFRDVYVQAHDVVTRQSVFRLLRTLLQNAVYGGVLLRGEGAGRPPFALDFAAGFAAAMNGEKDPRCLLEGLHIARHVLSGEFGDATEPLCAELFEIISCYFPITFTPPPNNPHGITNAMLTDALNSVFSASPRLAPHVLPLLLEKLGSALPADKRAALVALAACVPAYDLAGLCGGGLLATLASALRREVVQSRDRDSGSAVELGREAGLEAPGAGALLGIRSHWTTGLREGTGSVPAKPWGESVVGGLPGSRGLPGWRSAAGYSLLAPPVLAHEGEDESVAVGGGGGVAGDATGFSGGSGGGGGGGDAERRASITNGGMGGGGGGAGREEALKAIAAVTRVLAAGAGASLESGSAAPQYWVDWFTYVAETSVQEVERAPESIAGRASARVLCAVASASHATLRAVLARVVPLAVEAHIDATAHGLASTNAAVLGLLAGLVNTVDAAIAHAPGEHPLDRHLGVLLALFGNALGHGGALAVALAPERVAPPPLPQVPAPPSEPMPLASLPCCELRCIAAAALCDLVARPAVYLLTENETRALLVALMETACEGATDQVRSAAMFALCVCVEARPICEDLALRIVVPSLREEVRAAISGAPPPPLGADALTSIAALVTSGEKVSEHSANMTLLTSGGAYLRALRALSLLGRIFCSRRPSMWRAVLSVMPLAYARGAGGRLQFVPAAAGAFHPHPLAVVIISGLSVALSVKAAQKESQLFAELLTPVEELAKEDGISGGDGGGEAPIIFSLFQVLLCGLASEDNPVAQPVFPAMALAIERIFLLTSVTATPFLSVRFRSKLATLLLGLPMPVPPLGRRPLLPAAPHYAPLKVGVMPTEDEFALLRVCIAALSVCEPGGRPLLCCHDPPSAALAPSAAHEVCPLLTKLLIALCALVLQSRPLPFMVCLWESSAPANCMPICVAASRCVGSLMNRVPSKAVDALAVIVAEAAAEARASGDVTRRHRAALLYVWAVKGLLQRSHAVGGAFLSTLLDWLEEAGEDLGPPAEGEAAGGAVNTLSYCKDPQLVLVLGGGLFSATEENEPMSEFSREAGGILHGTYRQRIFAATKARCIGAGRSSAALLFAVCSMLTHLPPVVLLQDAGGNAALVVRALQMVGCAAFCAGAGSEDGPTLVDSVRVAALKSLVCIVSRAPAAVEPHVIALAEPLLMLTRFAGAPAVRGPRPLIRASALDALRALASLPHPRLHPVRERVLQGLLPALDDPKRNVRRRAGACRNDWAVRR
jgi:hypothetical protein